MGLHFYLNGTEGQKDGILISSGDLTNPIVFDGMYPGSATVKKTVNVAIRADAGEVWRFVNIVLKGTHAHRFTFANYADWYMSSTKAIALGTGGGLLILKVTDTNKVFQLTAAAAPTDTGSPDTTVKLVSWGWQY